MPHILWLTTSADAATCPAGPDEARLVAELMSLPRDERARVAADLRTAQLENRLRPDGPRRFLLIRLAPGKFRDVPAPLARWLADALTADETATSHIVQKLREHNGCPPPP